jgi:hypothetical protein
VSKNPPADADRCTHHTHDTHDAVDDDDGVTGAGGWVLGHVRWGAGCADEVRVAVVGCDGAWAG